VEKTARFYRVQLRQLVKGAAADANAVSFDAFDAFGKRQRDKYLAERAKTVARTALHHADGGGSEHPPQGARSRLGSGGESGHPERPRCQAAVPPHPQLRVHHASGGHGLPHRRGGQPEGG